MLPQELLMTKYEILEWIIQLNDISILEQIKKLKENIQPFSENPNQSKFPISFKFGSAKGLIQVSPDFDEPLEEFSEYM